MPVVIRRRPKAGGGHSGPGKGPQHEASVGPSEEEYNDEAWRKKTSRLDAEVFRGLREEMDQVQAPKPPLIFTVCNGIVITCILLNSLQMGLAIQDKDGRFTGVFNIMENLAGMIFTMEMIGKLYYQRKDYFFQTWNLLDFFLVWMSILSNWIFPFTGVNIDVSVFIVLRLLRCLRIVKLLRAAPALRLLVEGMFKSMVSLGWILVLLGIITYLFSIICYQALDETLYTDMPDFDLHMYFGDLIRAMLTLFNMCILAEWVEVVRPVWDRQAYVVLFVFVPYLMLATFGILNLIIGVIAEQTMETSADNAKVLERLALREKMKAIIRMTEKLFQQLGDKAEAMTKDDFINVALRSPEFIELMRSCNFPRGFDLWNLHLIFDDSSEGTVDQEEFINGMFRLVFNDLSQHAACILLGISQVKSEIKTEVQKDLHTILAQVKREIGQETEYDFDVPREPQEVNLEFHAMVMDDADVHHSDDMDEQVRQNLRLITQASPLKELTHGSHPCVSPHSRISEGSLLSQQMEQILESVTQLRETSQTKTAESAGVNAELASLRQCLSESHQKIQDKILLTQQPPLADQPDWTSQVADALRPVLREEIQRSKAAGNISPWSGGFAPRDRLLQVSNGQNSPREPDMKPDMNVLV